MTNRFSIRKVSRANWTRATSLGLMALVASGAMGGCAEERDPINRVQPNAMAKSFFVGADLVSTEDDPAFYARAVITDVGYGAAQDGLFTASWAQPVSVIKWEITEDLLVGRIVYNRIIGADGEGDGQSSIDGQVAYAFPIVSHFDIRRDYNPTTGEEANVIGENSSDRGWNEREYFRVDWSRNLNTDAYDFDTLSLIGIYGGISYEPLSYYVNDPKHPDAPHFATNEGYFDITTKAFASPGVIDLSHLGWGIDSFPACFLPNDLLGGSAPYGNCNPVEVTLRMSFRRAEVSDYQPMDMDGKRFATFGIFYGERFGYARNYGITDNQWYRFAARYNIWDKSHSYKKAKSSGSCSEGYTASAKFPGQCEVACFTPETTPGGADPGRDIDGNGTDDECELVGNGSQCDRFEQKCTMPYQDRKAKPLVWHYAVGSQPFYAEGTQDATHEWDIVMRTAVQSAKYSECVSVGRTADECLASFPLYRGQQEENEDAINLGREVDDCRRAFGPWAAEDGKSEPWSKGRLKYCEAQAESIGAARGYSRGVIDIAKMDEMVTMCHSPIQYGDSPLCVEDMQRLMPEADRARDTRSVLPKGTTAADCDAQFELRFDKPAEVDQELLATCDAGFNVRVGDLRFHQINVIKNAQSPSSWGIMVDADDPRTGEKIQASINVWSHVNDLASQGLVDTLRYIGGEIPTEEITDGTYVRDWAAAANAASGQGVLSTMNRESVERRRMAVIDGRSFTEAKPKFDAAVFEDARRGGPDPVASLPAGALDKSKELFKSKLSKIQADAYTQPVNRPFSEARRLAAQNTQTEAALITEPMMQLAGMNRAEISQAGSELAQGQIGTSGVLASASILRGLNPQIQRDMRQARELALADRGSCILSAEHVMAPAPNTLGAMTKVLQRKFGNFNAADDKTTQLARAAAMQAYLGQRFQYAVISHEMGHSIGHRHNFVSSYYAYGYRPQYWQLRTKNGTVTSKCTDLDPTGEDCVGPRYFDPPTDEESDQMIQMFQHSTVMDYPGDISQDLLGLGPYDFAAARFFYGDVMPVYNDPTYSTTNREVSQTLLNVTDTFGGIVGYQYVDRNGDALHYSQLQDQLALIKDCQPVDPQTYKPKSWDDTKNGTWDVLADGLIVTVDGQATRCKSQELDFVQYEQMRPATAGETNNAGFYGGGQAVDTKTNRLRVPYGFATDGWADLGNLSVYRHDNGADPYELFNFFITEQEARHIFDNYRRSRTTFSVKSQSGRILGRYNEKMRDGAKGLGLFANIYRDFYAEIGLDYDSVFPVVGNLLFPENLLAAGIAFDHFTRQFNRPQTGAHGYFGQQDAYMGGANVLRSLDAATSGGIATQVAMFDGGSGYFNQVAPGAKLVENRLSDDNGEFDRDYTMNVGSYYDKVYAPFLLTESVDNFISDSLSDFIDPRVRSVSMASLVPDGYRRFLANNLTTDAFLTGPRIAANGITPLVDGEGYPTQGIGWTSWWTPTPEVCFPGPTGTVCTVYGCASGNVCEVDGNLNLILHPLDTNAPAATLAVDPQVGWEEWKWLITQTLLYLPENARTEWIDLMGIWEIGADTDPGFANRIELHLPDGRTYVARTYGTEVIFGKTVQRGVGARILEHANDMLRAAYVCNEVAAPSGTGTWCEPVLLNGQGQVKYDPAIAANGTLNPNCNAGDASGCTCSSNLSCGQLGKYKSLPAFLRQSMRDFRMADASMKGIYD